MIIHVQYKRYATSPNDKILNLVDSSRMVGLVQLLLKSNAANCLIEDYAACLELRSEESQLIENSTDDPGVLILQVSPDCYNFLLPYVLFAKMFVFLTPQIAASN